jgi:hypothetical protein
MHTNPNEELPTMVSNFGLGTYYLVFDSVCGVTLVKGAAHNKTNHHLFGIKTQNAITVFRISKLEME